MPKTPGDATRFTATGPVASTMAPKRTAEPGSIGSRIDFGRAPPNESPQQKIARLRAAAAAARRPVEGTFDRVVRVGRVWADRAHRVTVYSLMGLSVVSLLVASAGITDMVLHNRQRRRDWFAEQEIKRKIAVGEAQRALAGGTITQDQLLLLGQERARFEAREALENRPGLFKRASNYIFSGWSKEEQKGGILGSQATSAQEKLKQLAQSLEGTVETPTEASEPQHIGSPIVRSRGGPLDQEAQLAYDTTIQRGRSWQSWLRGQS